MGKKHCEEKGNPCNPPYIHVHCFEIYTKVSECHRHIIRGVTSPAADTRCHKHEYEGTTSCNDGHTHCYRGCTEEPQYMSGCHVHDFCGKTSCDDGHKHHYNGITGRDRRCR